MKTIKNFLYTHATAIALASVASLNEFSKYGLCGDKVVMIAAAVSVFVKTLFPQKNSN
jgi:hypothetical protein